MKKIILLSFLFIISITGFSQIEEAIEEAPAMEEAPAYSPSISNDRDTRTAPLYKEYQWIHNRYRSGSTQKYGVLKNGEKFLPMIFQKGYGRQTPGKIILGLNDNYGVYDLDLEKWTIPVSYKALTPLSNNYFVARIANTYGLIDDNNNILLPFKFSSLSAIKDLENYVIASQPKGGNNYDVRYGIYSIVQGKWTTQPIYRKMSKLNTGNDFKVQNETNLYNIVDVNGKTKFKNWYKKLVNSKRINHYIVELNGKMGIINEEEKAILPIEYQYIAERSYNDGSYLAQNKEGKFGCISVDGRVTLPFKYDNIEIQNYNNIGITTQNDKCGIIQVNNGLPYEITTCDYDDIKKGKMAFIIQQNGQFGLMDLYGKVKSTIDFSSIKALSNSVYLAQRDKQFYLMNNSGQLLNKTGYKGIEPIYQPKNSRYSSSKKNFSYFKVLLSDKKYGVIDQTGALMPTDKFDNITGEVNNTFIVENNGKIGVYSIMKKKLIVPCEYDYISPAANLFYGFKGNDVYSIRYANQAIITKL